MKIKDYIPGLFAVILTSIFSYYLSTVHASFDALVISIIIGMLLSSLIGENDQFRLKRGVELSTKIFLPTGIALYGSQLYFREMHGRLLLEIFVVFACVFGLTLFIARLFNLNKKLSVLLASGLSICGASAIAVISPMIGARKEDTSISIISVMMIGLFGMIFYPILFEFFALTKSEFNFLAGATLPMIGQVKVAAGNVGPECVPGAVKIKLIRVSFLFFLVTVSTILSGKPEKRLNIPWFIIAFIGLALFVNYTKILEPVAQYLKLFSGISLSAGLAAIGYSVDFDSVIEEGITPLGVVFSTWIAVILVMYFTRSLF